VRNGTTETGGFSLSLLRLRRMIQKELLQLFRDPRTKRIIFAAPVVQLVVFGYAVNTDVHDVAMFVVDHDRTALSRGLLDDFTASGYFRVVGRSDDDRELGLALDRGRAVVGLEVPPGFAADVAAGRSPAVRLVVDGSNSNTATVASGYALKIAQQAMEAAVAGASGVPSGVVLQTRAWFNPSLESRVYNIPAVIGVIVLLMSLLLTALAVVRERELGTLDQLLVSPLSAWELILGKTIPVAAVAMVQLGLVTTVALVWFQIPLRGSVLALVSAAILFILAGLSFGLLISTISRTQQEAFLAMFLFLLPMIILSGFLYPVETMPRLFQEITWLNPLRHFLEVVRAIFLKGASFGELRLQLALLAVMAGGGVWVATRRFKAML
jgi:ABC-2 type transport system permease protein